MILGMVASSLTQIELPVKNYPTDLWGITGLLVAVLCVSLLLLVKFIVSDRKVKKKNGYLEEAVATVKGMDEKLDKVSNQVSNLGVEMKNMKKHCSETSGAAFDQIKENRKRIFDMKASSGG